MIEQDHVVCFFLLVIHDHIRTALVKGLNNLGGLGTRSAFRSTPERILCATHPTRDFPGPAVGNENTWFFSGETGKAGRHNAVEVARREGGLARLGERDV